MNHFQIARDPDPLRFARAGGALAHEGFEPDDTPQEFYKAMGFEPACLVWGWLKLIPSRG